MRMLLITLAACLLTVPAMAAQPYSTYTYDWEDGIADYLGTFNTDMVAAPNVVANRPGSPGYGLVLTKNRPATQSPQSNGFMATVWGLQAGDQVTASIWRFDDASALPNLRLTAHYNNELGQSSDVREQNLQLNHGVLPGRTTYGEFAGWEEISHTWTIEPGNTGLVINAVVYGDQDASMIVDDITIIAPANANVRLPNAYFGQGQGVPVSDAATWTAIKSLFR